MEMLERTARELRKRGYEVSCFETGEEASAYMDSKIDGLTVGFGDSETILALHLYERLSGHNEVYDPKHPREGKSFYDINSAFLQLVEQHDLIKNEKNIH